MKLAIAYSTKDEVANSEQTLGRLCDTIAEFDIYWGDGSTTDEGQAFFDEHREWAFHSERVTGGADASIAWKLSAMLASQNNYTHIVLLENDVLLDQDWFEPTMALFEKGQQDGFEVGAVSPRSYVDRVLIQRDGYGVMHNLGAGVVIFTRQAAEIVLRAFRTHWWPDNVRLFASLAEIDLRTYAAFRGQEQFVTTDWGWDAQLAAHGLASLALTPAKCRMVGQKIPLEQQGLELTTDPCAPRNDEQFEIYRNNLTAVDIGRVKPGWPYVIHREGAGQFFFPHQLGFLEAAWSGDLELVWSQGFGPFSYRAGPGTAFLSVRISGTCSFLVGGGHTGAQVIIEDKRSGFKASPSLPPVHQVTVGVPGSPISRVITMQMDPGAVFYGLQTSDAQMIDTSFRFDWSQLPEAK